MKLIPKTASAFLISEYFLSLNSERISIVFEPKLLVDFFKMELNQV